MQNTQVTITTDVENGVRFSDVPIHAWVKPATSDLIGVKISSRAIYFPSDDSKHYIGGTCDTVDPSTRYTVLQSVTIEGQR